MKTVTIRYICFFTLLLLFLTSCASSHFATMSDVQQAAQAGDYQRAEDLINDKEELKKARNLVLYLLDAGMVAHLNGKYEESNRLFAQAEERMQELDVISLSGTASEWLISDKVQPYRGEDFERVIVHYYMALNYLMLNQLEDALVECRRVNLLLREFNDRYEHKNIYKTDAFILYLSGIIYDAMGEVNDAFIDYRHAYNTYLNDYQSNYGTSVPGQLAEHLLRTSSALGFSDSFEQYEQEFPQTTWPTQREYRNAARLVVIWDNGLIPYKVERAFREYIELNDNEDAGCYVKFTFPEFVWRVPTFTHAEATVNGTAHGLELGEDVARIAIKNLEDRRVRITVKAVTRNVIKCAAEYEIEKENRILGFLFGLLTELTEGADTRHWFLLPASIHLTQFLLPPGVTDVDLAFSGASGQPLHHKRFENVTLKPGETTFLIYRTF